MDWPEIVYPGLHITGVQAVGQGVGGPRYMVGVYAGEAGLSGGDRWYVSPVCFINTAAAAKAARMTHAAGHAGAVLCATPRLPTADRAGTWCNVSVLEVWPGGRRYTGVEDEPLTLPDPDGLRLALIAAIVLDAANRAPFLPRLAAAPGTPRPRAGGRRPARPELSGRAGLSGQRRRSTVARRRGERQWLRPAAAPPRRGWRGRSGRSWSRRPCPWTGCTPAPA